MIDRIKREIQEFLIWMRLASNRLAALAGIAAAVIIENQQLRIGLLGIIPADPFMRLVMSIGIGALVFLVPFILRTWPQQGVISDLRKHFEGGDDEPAA